MKKNNGSSYANHDTNSKSREAMHSSDNAFVKSEEAKMRSMGGKAPMLSASLQRFNAEMSNSGPAAQKKAKSLTKGIDKAFPVK